MKKIRYLFIMVFLAASILGLIACKDVEINGIDDFPGEDELSLLIEKALLEDESLEEINIVKSEIIASFMEGDNYIVLANIYKLGFIPREGIFEISSGLTSPMEIHLQEIDGSFQVNNTIYPMDGSEFTKSVKKMSRDNKIWYNKLLQSQNSYDKVYNHMLLKLEKDLLEREISGYTHHISMVPAYSEDVILLKDLKNIPSGNVGIAREDEYYRAKDQIGIVNWPHYRGVLYNIETGISIERFFDEFPY